MNLVDLKGHLLARQANLAAELRQKRQTVVLIEADLVRARREADTVSGALQATEAILTAVEPEAGAQRAGEQPAGAVPPQAPGTATATPRNG